MYTTKNQKAASRPEVKKAQLRDILSGFFKTLLVIAAVFVIIAVIYKTTEKFISSDEFNVKSIKVVGNHSVSKADIVKAGGLYASMNIYTLKTDKIKQGIIAHPDIEKVEIEREMPTNLIIRVKEREPMALLKTLEGKTLPIDRRGHILSENKLENASGLPLIISDKETGVPGQECKDKKVITALDYLLVIRHAPERNFLKIKTIDVRQKDALVFKTVSIDEIYLSEQYSMDEVAKVFEVIKNLRENGRGASKIDARYEDVAVVCKYL
ncbi:FtsQ-type POTRA domain-containing protein [bacterium]|nr:FtsQ-type POTRA domain-containing protein [bacterium]